MNKILLAIGIGAAASVSLGSITFAQELQEIVVTGRAVTETSVGKTASGVPIIDMSISYGVSYAGLDLASAAGASELEKRVNEAAKDACKALNAQRPLEKFTTSDTECVKAAADKAMIKVRELEAAAKKK